MRRSSGAADTLRIAFTFSCNESGEFVELEELTALATVTQVVINRVGVEKVIEIGR